MIHPSALPHLQSHAAFNTFPAQPGLTLSADAPSHLHSRARSPPEPPECAGAGGSWAAPEGFGCFVFKKTKTKPSLL